MANWNPTRIRWVGRTLQTSTGATLVETDQGPAYAKLLGNPEGPHTLFCELVGTRAALWLGLPTFDTSIVTVDESLVTFSNGASSRAGPAFLTRYEDGAAWGGSLEELASVENKDILSGLVVLDTWLLNCDRYRTHPVRRVNHRNVFLSGVKAKRGRYRVVAMDHTHTFTCGRSITPAIAHLESTRFEFPFGHFPEFRALVTPEDLGRFAARLGQLDRPTAKQFLKGVPNEWEVAAPAQNAVVDFLVDRANYVSRTLLPTLVREGFLEAKLDLEG